ncbi:MAG: ABC transporter permease [Bdellovibrionota bacterium]
MPLRFEPFVALRYLRSKRKEVFISIITVISVVGVAVSVMVLDIVLGVMTGFEEELQSKLIDAGAHITIRGFAGDIQSYKEIIAKIRTVDSVVAAEPFTYNQAMISTQLGARGLLIRGIADAPESREKLAKVLTNRDALNDLFAPPPISVTRPDGETDDVQLPALIVGKALQQRLNILRDTPVTLISPELGNSPQGLVPKARRFLAVGSYSSGLIEYENGLAYASLPEAQRFFGLGDSVSGIDVTVKDLFQAKAIAAQLIELLGGAESGLDATDWTEPNKPLWEAMKLEKQVYFIVLLLLILIASVSIVNTLVMVVMEKSRDIAIMKSMGARDRSVLAIFILQGGVIGTLGIALGTLFGYLGCVGLRRFGFPLNPAVFSVDQVPIAMIPANFVVVAICAFFITLSAGLYPAYRAARLRPAEVLRFE